MTGAYFFPAFCRAANSDGLAAHEIALVEASSSLSAICLKRSKRNDQP